MGNTLLVNQILAVLLVDGKLPNYSEQQILDAIHGIVDPEMAQLVATAMINAHGYPDLSEEDLRNILRGIVDNQMA